MSMGMKICLRTEAQQLNFCFAVKHETFDVFLLIYLIFVDKSFSSPCVVCYENISHSPYRVDKQDIFFNETHQ
jgi:hypothetical protein